MRSAKHSKTPSRGLLARTVDLQTKHSCKWGFSSEVCKWGKTTKSQFAVTKKGDLQTKLVCKWGVSGEVGKQCKN